MGQKSQTSTDSKPERAPRRQTRGKFTEAGEPLDNFTKVPNELWGLYAQGKLSGIAQLLAIAHIMHKSWGIRDKKEWAKISLTEFAKLADMTPKTFELVLADAVKRGLIAMRKDGNANVYQARPQDWANVPEYEPPKKTEEPAAEPDSEDADDAASASAPTYSGDTLVVLPGKHSRPVPLRLAIASLPEPVELPVEYFNELRDIPLAIAATMTAGRLRVTVRQNGEEKANDHRNGLRYPEGETKANDHRNGLRCFSDAPASNQRLTDFTSYMNAVCLRHWQKAADPALVRQVLAAAGEATIEEFSTLVEQRLARGRDHKTGLLLHVAADAARAHAAAAALAATQPAPPARRSALDSDERERLRMDDPALYAELYGDTVAAAE